MEKERIRDIYGLVRGTVRVNGEKYFFKRNDAYVELLIEKIADLFNLKHAHYIPVNVYGDEYYISRDLNYEGRFVTAEDAGFRGDTLDEIEGFVLCSFPMDYDKLIAQIIKMFFMDLLTLNIDRNNDNWGFIRTEDGVDLCVLDNDLSFIHTTSAISAMEENKHRSSLLEVNNILDNFPQEYKELFVQMYNLLDEKRLEEMIKEVEKEIGKELPHKMNYINRFGAFRVKIRELLERKNKALML